ncbi:hypothetical protein [Streptomyces galbus]|uniref:Ig-like domain-containing protein n=1 Tax=Streptomyces galbus TaxID=33898 RepID=A0A4U5WWJ7_STRGB|nr:hypothetical protein [Streptomyces galbus]TKT06650.1 hypothetical protein E4U92_26785 [Streptomyces galbus]GHD53509.1 hypothetical protein GCM10010335_67060 [Streptomyces galbus]
MPKPLKTLTRFGYRLATLLMAACVLSGAVLLASPASAAGVLDVTCTPPSSATSTYSPPLTNTPQPSSSTVSFQFGPCVSLSQPALTSGTYTRTNPARPRSCLDLLSSSSGTFTITWNTGQTSTLSVNVTTTIAGAALVVTQTGTVTSGLFTGDTVVITQTGPADDVLLCTAGLGTVSSIYGLVTLEITSV